MSHKIQYFQRNYWIIGGGRKAYSFTRKQSIPTVVDEAAVYKKTRFTGVPEDQQYISDDGYTRIIQQLGLLLREMGALKTNVERTEDRISHRIDLIEERLSTVICNQGDMMRTIIKLQNNSQNSKDKPATPIGTKSTRKGARKEKVPKQVSVDTSKLLHLPRALQENVVQFMENFLFKSTNLPETLVENDCLTEDECSSLCSMQNPKDQIRLLIRKIKSRGPETIAQFLELVKQNQPHVAEAVYTSLDRISLEGKPNATCAVCLMIKDVDIQDVGDLLFQENIIDDDLWADIGDRLEAVQRKLIWSTILERINNMDDSERAIHTLIDALYTKYSHIANRLQELDLSPLRCCCKRRRLRHRMVDQCFNSFGSLTDGSTTSGSPRIPPRSSKEYDSLASSTQEDLSSLRSHSFDKSSYGRYDSNPLLPDSTSDVQEPYRYYKDANEYIQRDFQQQHSQPFDPNHTYVDASDDLWSIKHIDNEFETTKATLTVKPGYHRSESAITVCMVPSDDEHCAEENTPDISLLSLDTTKLGNDSDNANESTTEITAEDSIKNVDIVKVTENNKSTDALKSTINQKSENKADYVGSNKEIENLAGGVAIDTGVQQENESDIDRMKCSSDNGTDTKSNKTTSEQIDGKEISQASKTPIPNIIVNDNVVDIIKHKNLGQGDDTLVTSAQESNEDHINNSPDTCSKPNRDKTSKTTQDPEVSSSENGYKTKNVIKSKPIHKHCTDGTGNAYGTYSRHTSTETGTQQFNSKSTWDIGSERQESTQVTSSGDSCMGADTLNQEGAVGRKDVDGAIEQQPNISEKLNNDIAETNSPTPDKQTDKESHETDDEIHLADVDVNFSDRDKPDAK